MKGWSQKEVWFKRLVLILGAITVSCTAVTVFIQSMAQSVGEFIAALAVIAATGLLRLLLLPPSD